MRKIYIVFILLVLAWGTLDAQRVNIATNGGFEDATLGQTSGITGWLIEINAASVATLIVTDEQVAEGNLSLMGNVTTLGPESWSQQAVNEPVLVESGQYYRATLMVKTLIADSAHFSFTIGKPGPSFGELARIGGPSGRKTVSTEWEKLTLVFQATLDTVRVPIHFQSVGKTYIDDLQVFKSKLARAEIDESGDTLILHFGYNIVEPSLAFDLSSINVKADGNDKSVQSLVYVEERGVHFIKAVIDRVEQGAAVTVSYTMPLLVPLEYDDQREPEEYVPEFADELVDNFSQAVGIHTFRSVPELSYYLDESRELLIVSGLKDASEIELYNITGQRIKSLRVENTTEYIRLSGLHPGVYVLSVRYQDNSRANSKFVK